MAGVPIYIRTGKRLPARVTEVALTFQGVPSSPSRRAGRQLRPNALILRIQPNEGVSLHFGAKIPGEAFRSSRSLWTSSTTRPSPTPAWTATRGCSTTP